MPASLRAFLAGLCVIVTTSALAGSKLVRIAFKSGASEASVSGQIKGRAGVEYVFSATAGETIALNLKSETPGLGFTLQAPPDHELTYQATEFRGVAPTDGDYRVTLRVLAKDGAAAASAAAYTLQVTHEQRQTEEPVEAPK
jgi:hypothetical protein